MTFSAYEEALLASAVQDRINALNEKIKLLHRQGDPELNSLLSEDYKHEIYVLEGLFDKILGLDNSTTGQ